MDAEAARRGWIVAYPDAVGGQFNAGRCCNGRRPPPDDVRYVTRLVRRIAARHRVERSHVSAVGFSAGATMAYRLACERPEVFSAIAVVSGTEVVDRCRPTAPVSVLHVHARDDRRLPLGRGRFGSPSVPTLSREWRRRVSRRAATRLKTSGVQGPPVGSLDGGARSHGGSAAHARGGLPSYRGS